MLGHAGSKEMLDLELERKFGSKARPDSAQANPATPTTLGQAVTPPPAPAEQDVDGLPSTSSSVLSVPPSYASTPARSTSSASNTPVSATAPTSGQKPFYNTVPLPLQQTSTPNEKIPETPASSQSTRSKLKRRFSSSPSMVLKLKGDKSRINRQDGSVQT